MGKNDHDYNNEIFITFDGNIIISANNDNANNGIFDKPNKTYTLISSSGEVLNTFDDLFDIRTTFTLNNQTYIEGYISPSALYNNFSLFELDESNKLTEHRILYCTDANVSSADLIISIIVDGKLITFTGSRF